MQSIASVFGTTRFCFGWSLPPVLKPVFAHNFKTENKSDVTCMSNYGAFVLAM